MAKDLTGQVFNKLTVIKEAEPTRTSGGRRQRRWLCRCECGNEKILKQDQLTSKTNPTKSCGCIRKSKDITGERFGRLVVLGFDEPTYSPQGHLFKVCKCLCDCGNTKSIRYNDLVYGDTTSCGCYYNETHNLDYTRSRHGYSKTRLYRIWKGMKRRCKSPNCHAYKYYGEKGVKVAPEWDGEEGFLRFQEWAYNNGYNDELTIDRIDYNGDYAPNNCRWISCHEQNLNKSSNHLITYCGEKKPLKQWAEEYGINRVTLFARLNRGWSVEKALNTPPRRA